MSSVPEFYSDDSYSNIGISQFSMLQGLENCGGTIISNYDAMWSTEENYPMTSFDNSGDHTLPPEYSDIMSPVLATSTFPERLGINSNFAVPALPQYHDILSGIQNYGGGFRFGYACEFGDECCGFPPDFKPLCQATGKKWGNQGNHKAAVEDTNLKVGRYSVEERKDRILRYLKKRNQRNFNKTIKYACRKTLADRRVRVRGRFARNIELCEEEMTSSNKNNDNNPHNQEHFFSAATVQIKRDEEEWLQEAMSNLLYLPYFAG